MEEFLRAAKLAGWPILGSIPTAAATADDLSAADGGNPGKFLNGAGYGKSAEELNQKKGGNYVITLLF